MNQVALKKSDVLAPVSNRINEMMSKGEINFPKNYSPHNALNSFWLQLLETKDRTGKTALEVCTKESVMNAMLDMVLQGLSPAKKQCYPIVYGNKLQLQRSYFGTQAIAYRVLKAVLISAVTVHEGDTFDYEIVDGIKKVTTHKQKPENLNNAIKYAYCTIILPTGLKYTEIMTIDEIKQCWKQSKMNPVNNDGSIKDGVHSKFTQEMAKKTIINRTCKSLINATSDDDLVIGAFNRTTSNEYVDIDGEIDAQQSQANQEEFPSEPVDIDGEEIPIEDEQEEQQANEEPKVSDAQVKYINVLVNKIDKSPDSTMDKPTLKGIMKQRYSVDNAKDLTKRDASAFINDLKKEAGEDDS